MTVPTVGNFSRNSFTFSTVNRSPLYTTGSVQKEFSFFKPRYELDYNGWRCEGDFLAWEYDVYEACCVAVHISKKPFQWGDTYVIDIVDPKDEVMALMLAIAIDAANCTK